MKPAFRTSLPLSALLAALILSAACNRTPPQKNPAEQLAALDEAYKSGVFTKQEYDAKRAAIAGPAPVSSAPTPPVPAVQTTPPPIPEASSAPPESNPEPAPSDGCEDAEYKARKDGPQSRFFPQPMEKVRKATRDALKALDFTVHKDDTTGIEASKKRGIGVIVGAGGEREILPVRDHHARRPRRHAGHRPDQKERGRTPGAEILDGCGPRADGLQSALIRG